MAAKLYEGNLSPNANLFTFHLHQQAVQSSGGNYSMVGTTFGRYLIQNEIGRGGMGVVYRARDIKLDRLVAIKLLGQKLRSRPAAWGYLLKEAQIISSLHHPNICTVYDVGEENEQPYIAMEYIEGCALNMMLRPTGLTPKLVAHPARQIANALAHAHECAIIHRDIKSSNIVINGLGDVKILDFGLSKRFRPGTAQISSTSQSSSKGMGRMAGTIHYLAPEVLRGEGANVWTDIWSFGVLLYEMVTAELPFRGRTAFELATTIMTSDPAPPSKKMPVWMAHVIARCLERDVVRRYHCMQDIVTDLPREGMAECVDLAVEVDRFQAEPARLAALRHAPRR
jgi:serine/threonine protein kinase